MDPSWSILRRVRLGHLLLLWVFFEPLGQDINRQLVGGHHDGRVGDLTNELGSKAAIKAATAFVLVHCVKCLPKRSVDGVLFS